MFTIRYPSPPNPMSVVTVTSPMVVTVAIRSAGDDDRQRDRQLDAPEALAGL